MCKRWNVHQWKELFTLCIKFDAKYLHKKYRKKLFETVMTKTRLFHSAWSFSQSILLTHKVPCKTIHILKISILDFVTFRPQPFTVFLVVLCDKLTQSISKHWSRPKRMQWFVSSSLRQSPVEPPCSDQNPSTRLCLQLSSSGNVNHCLTLKTFAPSKNFFFLRIPLHLVWSINYKLRTTFYLLLKKSIQDHDADSTRFHSWNSALYFSFCSTFSVLPFKFNFTAA